MPQPTLDEIVRLAAQLSTADQLQLASRLSWRSSASTPRSVPGKIVSLKDKYAGRVPQDFEAEEALRECRSEWLKELDAIIDGDEIP